MEFEVKLSKMSLLCEVFDLPQETFCPEAVPDLTHSTFDHRGNCCHGIIDCSPGTRIL